MSRSIRDHKATIMRMAGNIASGLIARGWTATGEIARESMCIARAIVAEVEKTEPDNAEGD